VKSSNVTAFWPSGDVPEIMVPSVPTGAGAGAPPVTSVFSVPAA
jgi:hypothetical protein